MAESTSQTSGTQSASVSSTTVSKQSIRVSTYDDELEPDALRGSDQVIKDSGVVDKEGERRKRLFGDKEEKK
jgi:hypothetical protein